MCQISLSWKIRFIKFIFTANTQKLATKELFCFHIVKSLMPIVSNKKLSWWVLNLWPQAIRSHALLPKLKSVCYLGYPNIVICYCTTSILDSNNPEPIEHTTNLDFNNPEPVQEDLGHTKNIMLYTLKRRVSDPTKVTDKILTWVSFWVNPIEATGSFWTVLTLKDYRLVGMVHGFWKKKNASWKKRRT